MVRISSTYRAGVRKGVEVDAPGSRRAVIAAINGSEPAIPEAELARARAVRAELLSLWSGSDASRKRFVAIAPLGEGLDGGMLGAAVAVSFTQIASSALVIDADMRQPSLHQIFGTPAEPGLCDVLRERRRVRDAIYPTILPNLDIVPIGERDGRAENAIEAGALMNSIGDGVVRSMVTVVVMGSSHARAISTILKGFDAVVPMIRRGDVAVRDVSNFVDSLKRQGIPLAGFVVKG